MLGFWLVPLSGHFEHCTYFLLNMNMQLVQGDWQLQILVVVIFLINFGAQINILFIIRVRTLELIQWLYKSPSLNYVEYLSLK